MRVWIIATGNLHKLEEIQSLLPENDNKVIGLKSFTNVPEVIEDADTFEGNAAKKALGLAEWLEEEGRAQAIEILESYLHAPNPVEFWALADDSGLEVDALNGAPGVKSARYAAAPGTSGNAPDAENNAKLLKDLEPHSNRQGRFRCVLAAVKLRSFLNTKPGTQFYGSHDILYFSGACEGRIDIGARGSQGFGYDPLFIPDGYDQSFGELGEEVKSKISHRSKALKELIAKLSI